MTGMSLRRRKPAGEVDTLSHKHRLMSTSHTVFIGRYRDSISCQIEMGIKEEAGNYLSALSKRFVNDRRCEERTGLRGWMTQSFVSVNPIERRSTQSREFVFIWEGGHLIIAVIDLSITKGN
ncbi:hypothetical protein XENOCAPTIV_001052 [Xenoophorus captivus]|uniref:Uncharacterized protein n=1 Tax=Xenoophorus captivus TaxID=1517983 RepID=A0ABV0Q810_9TELE